MIYSQNLKKTSLLSLFDYYMKNIFATLIATSAIILAASTASAAGYSNCEVVYGGGEVCSQEIKFTIDKKVQTGTKGGQFVENLTVSDPLFKNGANVMFQISIKNTGSKTISKAVITDTLPAGLDYVTGAGTYNATNRTITINVENLEAGKEAVYHVTTKVNTGKGGTVEQCITNTVKAIDGQGASAEDTANICVEKTVTVQPAVPTKNIPNTGPEALALVILPPLGAAGLYLRRKASL